MKRLVVLYPRAWRRRYEEEYTALLDECPTSFVTVLSILGGAFDAHWSARRAGGRTMMSRPSRSVPVLVGVLVFVVLLIPINIIVNRSVQWLFDLLDVPTVLSTGHMQWTDSPWVPLLLSLAVPILTLAASVAVGLLVSKQRTLERRSPLGPSQSPSDHIANV